MQLRRIVTSLRKHNLALFRAIHSNALERVELDSIGDFVELDIVIQEAEELARSNAVHARHVVRKIMRWK